MSFKIIKLNDSEFLVEEDNLYDSVGWTILFDHLCSLEDNKKIGSAVDAVQHIASLKNGAVWELNVLSGKVPETQPVNTEEALRLLKLMTLSLQEPYTNTGTLMKLKDYSDAAMKVLGIRKI